MSKAYGKVSRVLGRARQKLTKTVIAIRKLTSGFVNRKFVYEARKALFHSERAVRVIHQETIDRVKEITVGYSSYIDLDFITTLKHVTIPESPFMKVNFEGGSPAEILSSIRRGDWHCGLVVLPIDEEGFSVIPLFRAPVVAAVPKQNAIAKKRILRVDDLKDQHLVIPARRVNPSFHVWLISKFADLKLTSKVLHAVSSPHEAQYLASQGSAIAIANAGAFRESRDGIVLRRIEAPGLETEVALVLRRGTRTGVLERLVHRIVAVARQKDQPVWNGHRSA